MGLPINYLSLSLISMKIMVTLLLLLVSMASFAQNTGVIPDPSLSLPQAVFDSDTCCWRMLADKGKYLEAANLIVSYLDAGKASNTHSLYWHAGQMYAMGHEDDLAIKYFKRTYAKVYLWFGDSDAIDWYYYARGTVAFLENDREKLKKVIHAWTRRFLADLNYQALLKLNEHWGEDYNVIFE